MIGPVRLQLSRRKGFDLQALSMATNGLPAVNVARPSKWGNPFKIDAHSSASDCVRTYRLMVEGGAYRRQMLHELRGKNLACWCALNGEPCHADTLLELANAPSLTSRAGEAG